MLAILHDMSVNLADCCYK